MALLSLSLFIRSMRSAVLLCECFSTQKHVRETFRIAPQHTLKTLHTPHEKGAIEVMTTSLPIRSVSRENFDMYHSLVFLFSMYL